MRGGSEMTFDVVGEIPSNHFVQQLGHALDNWCLDHIARVGADPGLEKRREHGVVLVEVELAT